ncbi:MAG: hypothetical protein GY940_03835 [bacterium]|nr:hypothetical protein [bacterium]
MNQNKQQFTKMFPIIMILMVMVGLGVNPPVLKTAMTGNESDCAFDSSWGDIPNGPAAQGEGNRDREALGHLIDRGVEN